VSSGWFLIIDVTVVGSIMQTGYCSISCEVLFNHFEYQLMKPVEVYCGLDFHVMRNQNVPRTDQKKEFIEAAKLIGKTFGDELTNGLIYDHNFYVASLRVNNMTTAALLFKIHPNGDPIFSEIPLAATEKNNHRRGYMKILMGKFENFLRKLGVGKMVLPSIKDALWIWVYKFGFATIPNWELHAFKKNNNVVLIVT
jgi:hypothetical protein